MKKVSEQRMKLRIEYSRQTDLIFSDNIPAYADWLEKKLALSQNDVNSQTKLKAEEFIPKNENGMYSRNEVVSWAEKYHQALSKNDVIKLVCVDCGREMDYMEYNYGTDTNPFCTECCKSYFR